MTDAQSVELPGCCTKPLGSYLKALGVFRSVAEQADSQARGYWQNGHFVLDSCLDKTALTKFFLHEWQPTPILAPWNGGSGFYPKDNTSAFEPMSKAKAERFSSIRQSIIQARDIVADMKLAASPKEDVKRDLLIRLRAELPEIALAWLDSAVLLTEGKPKYPPLLGTGGNDGRLDFTNNFLQRLVDLFCTETGEPSPEASEWIHASFFCEATPGLPSAVVGQFSPGAAGGPNATSGFIGDAIVNPWDFTLMLEGALLFAATATRRLETETPGSLSYPFSVRSVGSGSGGSALSDEKTARAEIWLPIWSAPIVLGELRGLLGEGRATLGRRRARDGLDFARAVARLGVQRGLDEFQRFAFYMRSGKAYFATPLNCVKAKRNVHADLIDQLDSRRWLDRFRRLGRSDNASNRLGALLRRLEDALFDLAQDRSNAGEHAKRTLVCLGEVQFYLGMTPAARESCGPVPLLDETWVTTVMASDSSAELRIAAALAGLHARAVGTDGHVTYLLPMADHIAPTESKRRVRAWLETRGHLAVWGNGGAVENLVTILSRRLLEQQRLGLHDKPLAFSATAPLSAVSMWLNNGLDTGRMAALLQGLALTRVPAVPAPDDSWFLPLPASYCVLKPFFCTNSQLHRAGVLAEDRQLPLSSELVRRISVGQVNSAVSQALQRLRIASIETQFREIESSSVDGRVLLSALLVPISNSDLRYLVRRISLPAASVSNQ